MVMDRDIDAATLAAISDRSGFYPVVMFHIDWPAAPVRAHSNRGNISWGGYTWTGVGSVADIRLPSDDVGMAAQDASLSMVGLGDDLDAYLGTDARGRDAEIYFGVVTERDGATLIGEPFSIFSGAINGVRDLTEFMEAGYSRGVQLPLISGPSQRSAYSALHSHEDQTAVYPGDTAGRFLINIEREAEKMRWPA